MKKMRLLTKLMICMVLLLSFAGHSFAQEQTADETGQERDEIIFEFSDSAEASWANQAIGFMKYKQILSGYEDGSFRPNKPVSRIEAVVTAVRLMGLEEQAKAKTEGGKLLFADAQKIDKQYKWARGYIIVALEKGLFDTSESKLDPEKPASRVWVSSLLVKALGLQEEALALMSVEPDFKDVKAIPAGSIGYVNVAVKQGIISGYPDETFKPQRSVTRAELASLLERTGENLQEQDGSVTVTGKVVSVEADSTNNKLIKMVVKSFNGDTLTYTIAADFPVAFHDRFITAAGILAGDNVVLMSKNGVIWKAGIISKEYADEAAAGINELEIKLVNDRKTGIELEYKSNKGKVKAEIEMWSNGKKEKLKGAAAVEELKTFLKEANLTPQLSKEEIQARILQALGVKDSSYERLEIEVKFSNGSKIEIDSKHKQESNKEEAKYGIKEFELELKQKDGTKLKAEYSFNDGKSMSNIEFGSKKLSAEAAEQSFAKLFEQAVWTDGMSKADALQAVLKHFEVQEADLTDVELEIKFSSGKKLEFDYEKDSKDRNHSKDKEDKQK